MSGRGIAEIYGRSTSGPLEVGPGRPVDCERPTAPRLTPTPAGANAHSRAGLMGAVPQCCSWPVLFFDEGVDAGLRMIEVCRPALRVDRSVEGFLGPFELWAGSTVAGPGLGDESNGSSPSTKPTSTASDDATTSRRRRRPHAAAQPTQRPSAKVCQVVCWWLRSTSRAATPSVSGCR